MAGSSLFYSLLSLAALLASRSVRSQGITNNNLPACNGIFDFYFVLDRLVWTIGAVGYSAAVLVCRSSKLAPSLIELAGFVLT